ncbi:hypothetical protein EV356DRAFT_354758 [Viridothelium virens]|uniref:Uncharacterized protein n=1 Tax=Viridothelium virens TaxID=1048519 RepID=A0A6A6GWB3_VIRVR|nr:hypothetical protein EV356DRAFT_354758 [Viridothelium virens]
MARFHQDLEDTPSDLAGCPELFLCRVAFSYLFGWVHLRGIIKFQCTSNQNRGTCFAVSTRYMLDKLSVWNQYGYDHDRHHLPGTRRHFFTSLHTLSPHLVKLFELCLHFVQCQHGRIRCSNELPSPSYRIVPSSYWNRQIPRKRERERDNEEEIRASHVIVSNQDL